MMGFDDLLMGALMSFAPSLLGGMFQQHDPRAELQRRIAQLYTPGNIANQTRAFQSLYPYSGAQASIAGATNSLSNQLGRTLGERGLNQSGVGAVSNALARSSGGFKLADLNSQAWQESLANAMKSIQGQASNLAGIGPSSNYSAQLFGAGLSNFGNFLKPQSTGNAAGMSSPYASQNFVGPPSSAANNWDDFMKAMQMYNTSSGWRG